MTSDDDARPPFPPSSARPSTPAPSPRDAAVVAGADAHPAAELPPALLPDASLAAPGDAPDPDAPPVKVPLALEDWLAVLTMGALVAITFANVVVRYFTDQSLAWTEEISVFLMIVVTLAGGSAAVARDRHIKIEYFLDGGTVARQRRLAAVGALATAAFFALLCGLSVRLVWDDIRYGETSPGIGVPAWWYSVWLPLLSAAIAGRAFGLFLRQRARRPDGDVPPLSPSSSSLPPAGTPS